MNSVANLNAGTEIPAILPVLSVPGVVLLPHAVLPLHLAETDHRELLDDVLAGNRLFVLNGAERAQGRIADPAVAVIGMVRGAVRSEEDGSVRLILQGLCRAAVEAFASECPYLMARVTPLQSGRPDMAVPLLDHVRGEIAGLLAEDTELTEDVPDEFLELLLTLEDAEAFLDLTVYAACRCSRTKRRVLETESVLARFALFRDYLLRRKERAQFFKVLQGGIPDARIDLN